MRTFITTTALLAVLGGPVAMAQSANTGSTATSANPPPTSREAPIGHRQPRAADVPSEKNLSNPNDAISREDAALDKGAVTVLPCQCTLGRHDPKFRYRESLTGDLLDVEGGRSDGGNENGNRGAGQYRGRAEVELASAHPLAPGAVPTVRERTHRHLLMDGGPVSLIGVPAKVCEKSATDAHCVGGLRGG